MRTNENHTIINFQIKPEYYLKHSYLTFCNDSLVSILQYADKNQLSTLLKFELKSGSQAKAYQQLLNEKGDWQSWLIENGYKDQLYDLYYKHIFFSLIKDFCNYMLESINCAAKMKVAVSYALLRKPLKDTLGFIEWLYVDKNEVVDLLINGTANQLVIEKTKAKYISDKIKELIGVDNYFVFRYDKNADISLEKIWNKASHLITKAEYCKTENGSLNFIFSSEENLLRFEDYYYLVVPLIMSYALDLIVPMFEEFAPINKHTIVMNTIIRKCSKKSALGIDREKELISFCNDSKWLVVCPRCGYKEVICEKTIRKLMSGKFRCNRCFKSIITDRYVFDWEKIDVTDNNLMLD